MPYRVRQRKGRHVVQVKRGTRWKTLTSHKSKEDAQKHLRALYANVKH